MELVRGDGRIAPTVILNELAATGAERTEIRVVGAKIRAGFFVCVENVLVEVGSAEVPLGVLVNRLPEIGIRENELRRSPVCGGYDPVGPGARLAFDAGRKAFDNLRSGTRIPGSRVDFGKRRRLGRGQAV